MKRLFVLATLILVSAFCTAAQSTTPVPPATHFTMSGSASSFSGSGGSTIASIEGAAIQVTPHFSAGYLRVDIPSISGRFEFGVINYTRTLHDILGNTLASKIAFDTNSINVNFQVGGGKLLQPVVNRIAETGGIQFSYPLTNNVSVQIVGINVLHGGTQTGFVTTNTTAAVSTGLNFSF